MTCVLAIVALAGFLQWVSLGKTTTENDYAAPFLTPVLAEGLGETTPPSPGPDYATIRLQPSEASGVVAESTAQSPMVVGTPPNDSDPVPALRRAGSVPSLVEGASLRISQSGGALSEEEMRAVLAAAGAPSEWVAPLLTIAWCESHYSPLAVGDSGNSLGLFQLWSGWFRAGEDPFDALTNARVAVRVREIRGRFGGGGGWSCADLNGIP